jgi:hypothetical protein
MRAIIEFKDGHSETTEEPCYPVIDIEAKTVYLASASNTFSPATDTVGEVLTDDVPFDAIKRVVFFPEEETSGE